jgi:ribosomal protein S2
LSSSIVAKQNDVIHFIHYRWLGGMLTNWNTVQNRIERLKFLEKQELEGNFETLSKKIIVLKEKKLISFAVYSMG